MRRLTEGGTKDPDEVGLGHVGQPRECRDVQWLREGAIHRVPGSEQRPIGLFDGSAHKDITSRPDRTEGKQVITCYAVSCEFDT